MTLGESAKVVWSNILYAPFINFAGGNVTGGYQVAQPLRGVWVDLVVISRHVGFLAGGSGELKATLADPIALQGFVCRIQFAADELAAEPRGDLAGGAAAEERIEDDVAGA